MQKLIIVMSLLGIIKFLSGCTNSSFFFKYGYNIKGDKVFYKQPFPNPVFEIENVDVRTFKVMSLEADSLYDDNTYFAVDKNAVYYSGWKIAGSDGASFQLIDINYAKDNRQCYYRGTVIKNADPKSFITKTEFFSADKSHIFRREMMVDADASVFEVFNNGYLAHTANAVAVYNDIVPISSGETFRYLGFSYFALNKRLYFHDKQIPDTDTTGFIALDDFFSKTDAHVFYGDKIIQHALPGSFRLLESPYGTDGQHIFFFERMIQGADVKTFEIINKNFQCARDKNAAYHEDKQVTHFTKADLANKSLCTNCNADTIYFAE